MTELTAVEQAVRRRAFGTLSTLNGDGSPQSTAVVYAVAGSGRDLTLYVTTRRTTVKARNIMARPQIAFVIPVPHRLMPMFPPAAIQFSGTAEVLDRNEDGARTAFRSSWFHRRILATEERIVADDAELCFLAIRPRRSILTYGIGMSAFDVVRRPREASGRIHLPAEA